MAERIFLGVAWPYANGSLHIGQLVGAYLPADIFARYHRTAGNDVLMVSGSDVHGTPITVRAEQEGRSPEDVASQYHEEFLECWEKMGITFDCYTSTGTENHARVTQDIFLKLLESGDIFKQTMELPYCTVEGRFLLDRYVEGTCPFCSDEGARGDQCDNCGRVLDPFDLKNPKCKFDFSTPERRESEHFFLRLSAYSDALKAWLSDDKEHWRKNVRNFALGLTEQGLLDRSITRDLTWGVRIPVEGYETKRIYVWFDAVIGYLSAAIEWAEKEGTPERWREWWQDPEAKSYYFIGKDNIWFHALIWPAQLMGYSKATGETYNLPYDVPANQFLTIKGAKQSTSKRLAVWVPDFLERYDPDPLRYYLSAIMPETADADFTWAGFVQRNNDELVATWGNLVNRVLTFTYKNFDKSVPEPGDLSETDRALISRVEEALEEAGREIAAGNFRAALEAGMSAAREANRYVEDNAPWKLLKEDRERCATVLYTAIAAISGLKTALYPFLPFTCQKLHGYLGNEGPVQAGGWRLVMPAGGRPLAEAEPLFKKLDPEIVEEEEAKLGV
ncbi:MAG: methionine--tRNA ligase [Chloroflexi bacterium]|nr:methionine--tRNA ligase [Chloroflexota bacterium]MCI0814252.1 methionine--tRNA ligase [Chloroflexota bacterium]MCI0817161.1 methionine--tRNA ligase [Chloroflexota bacterium]MCI0839320.1 methionine--tRNA ligase [Chloroflexota bacterium]MCI0883028.1 methionine--tRNA ligase [Chloroflexota bacterium]